MTGALIFGARTGSLGAAIAAELDVRSVTAGISGDELIRVDVEDRLQVADVISAFEPRVVISTVGVNVVADILGDSFLEAVDYSMRINFTAQMLILALAAGYPSVEKVVLISSNSAKIARRNSLAYCSSKAALSMAIRVAGRELAGKPLVWGYEFGLLADTPMTQATEAHFGPAQSRMVGAEKGLNRHEAARQVAADIRNSWHGLNGTLLRLDAGEQ